jgi:murein L,D-transpeptidase YcbB/YkuD
MDKVFYNQASEKKLGWEPWWFGVKYNDEELVTAVAAWQEEAGITADGLCGPSTYRRIWTEREANVSDSIASERSQEVIQGRQTHCSQRQFYRH